LSTQQENKETVVFRKGFLCMLCQSLDQREVRGSRPLERFIMRVIGITHFDNRQLLPLTWRLLIMLPPPPPPPPLPPPPPPIRHACSAAAAAPGHAPTGNPLSHPTTLKNPDPQPLRVQAPKSENVRQCNHHRPPRLRRAHAGAAPCAPPPHAYSFGGRPHPRCCG
jgi:hypothetical protein